MTCVWRQIFAHAFFSYLHFCSKSLFYEVKELTIKQILIFLEAVIRRCSSKKVFLKTCNLIKKNWTQMFFHKFAKFFRTPFFTEHLRWLLLSFLKKVKMIKYIYINIFTGKRQSFIVLLQAWGLTVLRKGDSILDTFFWNLGSFTESHFCRRQLDHCFRFLATFQTYHLLY